MATVVITDVATPERVAITTSDRNGRFRVLASGKRIAITATTDREMIYAPDTLSSERIAPMTLTSTCAHVSGRVDVVDHAMSDFVVRFSRVSKQIGDSFGAHVQNGGQFHLCVPSAYYTVTLPKELVAPRSFTFVPTTEPLSFRAGLQAETERIPFTLEGIFPQSLEAFVANLPASVTVLGIGESNHGTREFNEVRTRLAIELARKRGFSLVMIEAGYGEVLELDAYIGGANIDIVKAVEHLGYWPWDTRTFLDSLEQLRMYNGQVPSERRIHLVGFDVQDTTGAVGYLRRNGRSFTTEEESSLAKLGEADGAHWNDLNIEMHSATRKLLEKIAADRESPGAFSTKNQAALAARALLLRLDLMEAKNSWYKDIVRDAGMSRMILEVLALEPQTHASLWAHLAHLSREYVIGTATTGRHLSRQLGASYRVYALLAYSGTARAWDTKMKVGVIAHQIPVQVADGVEANLFRERRGSSVTYWDFTRATGDAARWLRGLHRLLEFGAIYRGDQNVFVLWDLSSIDGAVLFEHITPTIPTPTGERVAVPKATP
jgi:erythromycin esterase